MLYQRCIIRTFTGFQDLDFENGECRAWCYDTVLCIRGANHRYEHGTILYDTSTLGRPVWTESRVEARVQSQRC